MINRRPKVTQLSYEITAERDTEANGWVATSTDIPGLVVYGETMDEILRKCGLVVPALTEPGRRFNVTFRGSPTTPEGRG